MSTFREKVKHEIEELVPIILFFVIAFQLLAFTQALMLREYGISTYSFLEALIGALVVAKVVAIADHIPFINRFPQRPLIYNVLWKTAIYFAASLAVRYVEHIIHFWRHSADFAEANRRMFQEVVWPHFWCVQLWLLVLLLLYCAFRELARAIGRGKIVQMFFREPPPTPPTRPTPPRGRLKRWPIVLPQSRSRSPAASGGWRGGLYW